MTTIAVRRTMVENNHSQLSITKQCELLDIHRSGVYYTPSTESTENLEVMKILDKQYMDTPFYGVEKLYPMLLGLGLKVNRKRLRRLMKLVNWQTIYRAKRTTSIDNQAYKYPYLLKNLEIIRPNQVWAIDITYIPMEKGFMYLFAVIDVYSRFVVGWSLSNTMTTDWCLECINQAITNYGKPEIINSDQGSQFTSNDYVAFLKEKEIEISMDGKGRAIDNIFIERLWRTVKYENIYLYVYQTGKELWQGLENFFLFYNYKRLHQSLDYKTPEYQYYKNAS